MQQGGAPNRKWLRESWSRCKPLNLLFAQDKSRRPLQQLTWQEISVLEMVNSGLKLVVAFMDILSGEDYVSFLASAHIGPPRRCAGGVRGGCQTHSRSEVRHWYHPEDNAQSNDATPQIQTGPQKTTQSEHNKKRTGSRDSGWSNMRKSETNTQSGASKRWRRGIRCWHCAKEKEKFTGQSSWRGKKIFFSQDQQPPPLLTRRLNLKRPYIFRKL